MEVTLLFIIVFSVLSSHQTAGAERVGRTWRYNLNYKNSQNWDIDRVPCEADRVVLVKSEGMVLQLPEGTTALRALVLPEHSEVVLSRNGALQFSGISRSPTCDGKDAVFKHTEALRWTDPLSWDGWNNATPDLERVPCAHDIVRFSSGATYNVLTPDLLHIGSLWMNGDIFDSADWFLYSNEDEGIVQLHKADGSPTVFAFSNAKCEEFWCDCGNKYLQQEICNTTCPVPLCKQPVQPSGFCCPICGAYIHLSGRPGNGIKEKTANFVKAYLQDKGIEWHISYVDHLWRTQIVLVEENDYSGKVTELAKDLKNSLIHSGLGWTMAESYASGHVWYPRSFGQVVEHFFSLMVFAALIVGALLAVYSQNWTWTKWLPTSTLDGGLFAFVRFENQAGDVAVASDQPQGSQASGQEYMYGATNQEQRNVTIENPMYTEMEESVGTTDMLEESLGIDATDLIK